MTRKEVDLSTLYEDPYFDLHKKPAPKRRGFRTGKASMDARVQFGKIPGQDEEEPEVPEGAEGAATQAATSQQPTQDNVASEPPKPEDIAQ